MPSGALPGELAEAVLGAVFVVCGLVSLVAGLVARPRRVLMAAWFGTFCVMYGLRLAARSELVRAAAGWPDAAFAYAEAIVTYSILIPTGRFTEAIAGPGEYRLVRRLSWLTVAYAACATVYDLARGRPAAAMWLNAPVVLTVVPVFVWHTAARFRGMGHWLADIRAVAIAALLFTLVAFYETAFERPPFSLPFSVEPVAMLLLVAALGWFVLSRIGEQAAEHAALSRELRLAREIQQSLLPRQMPVIPGLRVSGWFLPMSAVAGDFYDVATRADGTVVLIVADVSGHGVPAALVASMVKVAFAAEVERYCDPGSILAGINRALTGTFERAYVTACCVSVVPGAGALTYAAAGHPPALLRQRDGGVRRLDEGGIALTLLPHASYRTADIPFQPGDRLVLYTDGLLEACRPGSDEFFGDAELERVLAAARRPGDTGEEVLDAYRAWLGPATPLTDDVTLVVVEAEEPEYPYRP